MKTKMDKFNAVVLGLGAMALCVIIAACSSKDDTQAIRELIQKGTGLAEAKQIGDLMDMALPDFTAHPGNNDVRQSKRILFGAFMHYGQFKIHYPRPSVEIEPDGKHADATIHFLIVRQDKELPKLKELYDDPRQWIDAAREKADLYQLKLTWVKQGGDWMVSNARMDGFKGTGF